MKEPNETLTLGTRLMLTDTSCTFAPVGEWLTVTDKQSWDGTEWWALTLDNNETSWVRTDSKVFSSAAYYRG